MMPVSMQPIELTFPDTLELHINSPNDVFGICLIFCYARTCLDDVSGFCLLCYVMNCPDDVPRIYLLYFYVIMTSTIGDHDKHISLQVL